MHMCLMSCPSGIVVSGVQILEKAWMLVDCIVPLRHGDTLNSRRATSPRVRFVEGEERWEAPDLAQGVVPLHWGWSRAKPYCHLHGAQS
ncbi:hypothetical protein TNCV_4035521 [Trichonephila clavipes]|nr:hypothetical protein TNCV_4035521 [Trichonephila clavipes]